MTGAAPYILEEAADEIERLGRELADERTAHESCDARHGDDAREIERLTRDIESGFMKGAYARLKNLQEAESERDRLRTALERIAACHGNANFIANEALGNGRVAYTALRDADETTGEPNADR